MRRAIQLLTLQRGGSGVSAPAKPTSLTATVFSTSRIDLAWTDAATTETEYRVYRSTDNVTFSLINTIAANSTSYSDTTITSGTTYYYKVAAYNAGGETLSDASNAANTLTLSLVSYWQLEEVSGTRVDSFGDNDLTPTNSPVNATGIVGNAVALVGSSSQQLVVANNATLQSGNIDHTIAAWFYPTTLTSGCIVTKNDVDVGFNAAGYEWMLYQVSNTKVRFLVARGGGGSGNGSSNVTSDVDVTLNAWNYVEGFYDATNALVGVVVNGTVKTASSLTVPGTSTGSVRIGAIGPGSSYMTGRIDEVAFWKRLLTTDERAAQYNGGAGRAPSFLAG